MESTNMQFCSKCGAPLESGSRFCAKCGAEVVLPAADDSGAMPGSTEMANAGGADVVYADIATSDAPVTVAADHVSAAVANEVSPAYVTPVQSYTAC